MKRSTGSHATRIEFLLAIALFAVTSSAWGQTPATAPSQAVADDRWEFRVSVPLWLPAVDGDVTVRGNDLSMSQDTGDTFDTFDSHLNGAFLLHFEAERNRLGALVDLMYLDVRAEGTGDVVDATGSLRGFVGELGGFYAVVKPPPAKKGWGMVEVDVLGGVRVSALEFGIHGDGFGGSVNRTIYDPFVGARVELGLLDWLSLKARGDVGGFGIDAWPTSRFSFNAAVGPEFHIAKWFDVGMGYRWLSYDFEGNAADSSFDATLEGPFVALTFNF
jgi:hypothetical protein